MSDPDRQARPSFEPIGSEVAFEGTIIRAGTERFRYADGTEVARDKVWHPGAVAILPVDEHDVWLVRQPREAIGLASSLEVPAGKRDVPGEATIVTAQRELAEEIGMQAYSWRYLFDFFPTGGFADERILLYVATALSPVTAATTGDEDDRLEIVRWPLDRLDDALAETRDAKTLIALLWLAGVELRR